MSQFSKGMIPWNKGLKGYKAGHPAYSDGLHFKGKKHSEESKERMRLAKLGKESSAKGKTWKINPDKLKNYGKVKGEEHWNWKGGTTSEDRLQRVSFRQKMQKKVFERDDYTCQICLVRGGFLQVDHIKSWSKFPQLRFEIDNCRTLCMKCHYNITFGKEMPEGVIWGHNLINCKII